MLLKLQREEGQSIFVSSDYHFDHKNIIKYCERPFDDARDFDCVDKMNQWIIENHNSLVKPNDWFIHIGDLVFGNDKIEKAKHFLSLLNGKKILLSGNHDKECTADQIGAEIVCDYLELTVKVTNNCGHWGKPTFILFHYPILQWNHKHHQSIHLFGHSHGSLGKYEPSSSILSDNRMMDVGIDTNNGFPYNLDNIYAKMLLIHNKSYDHHNERTT